MTILDLTLQGKGWMLDSELRLNEQRTLMEHPFFSLAKRHRTVPIHYQAGRNMELHVAGHPGHGIATLWDADILIWMTSRLFEAARRGLDTSPHLRLTPYRLLCDLGCAPGNHQYVMLRSALDRLHTTTVTTSIRRSGSSEHDRFHWIEGWQECVTASGRHAGIELILPDWFYRGALYPSSLLSLPPGYLRLPGGIERWLYRIARKHAGRQPQGWVFEMRHLYLKSGSLMRPSTFASRLRSLVARQRVPGYRLSIVRKGRAELLHIQPTGLSTGTVDSLVMPFGTSSHTPDGTWRPNSTEQESRQVRSTHCHKKRNRRRKNLSEESKVFLEEDNAFHGAAPDPEDGP